MNRIITIRSNHDIDRNTWSSLKSHQGRVPIPRLSVLVLLSLST